MKTFLLIGNCGSGKTWVLKQLLGAEYRNVKIGLVTFAETQHSIVTGVYDGSTFEGSDRLSMAVSKDFNLLQSYAISINKTVVSEGDRFTNSKFIKMFDPTIVKILDDGSSGRLKRGSSQSERHLKAIETRVSNIVAHYVVKDSQEALELLRDLIPLS